MMQNSPEVTEHAEPDDRFEAGTLLAELDDRQNDVLVKLEQLEKDVQAVLDDWLAAEDPDSSESETPPLADAEKPETNVIVAPVDGEPVPQAAVA